MDGGGFEEYMVVGGRGSRDAPRQPARFDAVTESQRAVEALLESEARLQALLSSFDGLVFELDAEGTYLGIWTMDDTLLIQPRSSLLGSTALEALGEEFGADIVQAIGRVLETGKPEILEYSLDVPAGRRWFQGRLAPIAGSAPTAGRICMQVRDITAQRAAEQEISRGIARLELMHEVDKSILEFDSDVDLAGVVLRQLRQLVGADRASIVLLDPAAGTASFLAIDPPEAPGPAELRGIADLSPAVNDADRDVRWYSDLSETAVPSPAIHALVDTGIRSLMSANIIDAATVIGELNVAWKRPDGIDPAMKVVVREMADQLAVALRQGRLRRASVARANELEQAVVALRQANAERLELLSRLVSAQEEERQRIASDLHDDSIQKVTAASMRLDMLAMAHPELADDEVFVKAKATVRASVASMRHLMTELRPYVLDRDGLGAALREVLEEGFGLEEDPAYELSDRLPSQPPDVTRVVLFRITQEALMNVRKHARASHVQVDLQGREGGYLVRVSDDGVGFDSENGSESPRGHLGLTSMRQRAQLAGGTCTIASSPGEGTVVETWVPTSWAAGA